MSKYIKLEDAIKSLTTEKSDWNFDYNIPIDRCIKKLKSVPSADVVEVVRCKECKRKRRFPLESSDEGTSYCWCDYWQRSIDDTDYCSKGRRKYNE